MKSLSRGDLILVPFPFTDLSARKVRPAFVVNVLSKDVLAAFISSVVPPGQPASTDLVVTPSHPEFSATGLKLTSVFKLAKLLCLDRSLILRRLGQVGPTLQREIDLRLARAVGLS